MTHETTSADGFMQSTEPPVYTLAEGRPVHDPTSSVVLRGPKVRGGGLALLEDTQLIETLAHFPRERIPERFNRIPLSVNFTDSIIESYTQKLLEPGVNSNALTM